MAVKVLDRLAGTRSQDNQYPPVRCMAIVGRPLGEIAAHHGAGRAAEALANFNCVKRGSLLNLIGAIGQEGHHGLRLPILSGSGCFFGLTQAALDKDLSLLHSKSPRRLRYLDLNRLVGSRV